MNRITYHFERWQSWAWESQTRYYCAQLQQDLFGYLVHRLLLGRTIQPPGKP